MEKNIFIAFCSIFLLTACTTSTPTPEKIDPAQDEMALLDCSDGEPVCAEPTCAELNCGNCSNPACNAKNNPNVECTCGKMDDADPTEETTSDAVVREISLDAKRFEYVPNEIRIKKGETVRIKIHNIDMEHNISIPAFGIENQEEATFTATESGEFEFYCPNMCGSGHRDMVGKIIVE